jgi:hypothetical protein
MTPKLRVLDVIKKKRIKLFFNGLWVLYIRRRRRRRRRRRLKVVSIGFSIVAMV